jgi:hypothetical protein
MTTHVLIERGESSREVITFNDKSLNIYPNIDQNQRPDIVIDDLPKSDNGEQRTVVHVMNPYKFSIGNEFKAFDKGIIIFNNGRATLLPIGAYKGTDITSISIARQKRNLPRGKIKI